VIVDRKEKAWVLALYKAQADGGVNRNGD